MDQYEFEQLAKRVRGRAAECINNETSVIQSDERAIKDATDIINLCNAILDKQDRGYIQDTGWR